jgi:hypothetical protein
LFGYNKWQERRTLRRLDRSLRGDVGDPLFDAPARPPPASRVADDPVRGTRIEPSFGADEPARAPTPPAPVAAPIEWNEDPLLDFVLELRCAHAVDGVAVIDAAASLARLGLELPVVVVAWDARTQQWVRPDRFGFYSELLVAVQLAHRRHALDEIEASRFLAAVQQLAVTLDADVDAPESARIVELARELDALRARFDVQIGLTLLSTTGPWDAARLGEAMARVGMTAAGPLRWQRIDADGRVLFAATSGSLLVDRLVLELDVPVAPPEAAPLRAMATAAEQLGAALGARVVDDHGHLIDGAAISAIHGQLSALCAEMRAAGVEPGSGRALRLYS